MHHHHAQSIHSPAATHNHLLTLHSTDIMSSKRGRGGTTGAKFRMTLGLPVAAVINCAGEWGLGIGLISLKGMVVACVCQLKTTLHTYLHVGRLRPLVGFMEGRLSSSFLSQGERLRVTHCRDSMWTCGGNIREQAPFLFMVARA